MGHLAYSVGYYGTICFLLVTCVLVAFWAGMSILATWNYCSSVVKKTKEAAKAAEKGEAKRKPSLLSKLSKLFSRRKPERPIIVVLNGNGNSNGNGNGNGKGNGKEEISFPDGVVVEPMGNNEYRLRIQ